MDYVEKLYKAYELNEEGLTFEKWLINESERNHKKAVKMAGDLGEAFSRIGELESKLKSVVSSSIASDFANGVDFTPKHYEVVQKWFSETLLKKTNKCLSEWLNGR